MVIMIYEREKKISFQYAKITAHNTGRRCVSSRFYWRADIEWRNISDIPSTDLKTVYKSEWQDLKAVVIHKTEVRLRLSLFWCTRGEKPRLLFPVPDVRWHDAFDHNGMVT